MAITDAKKVDYLWKKLGYGATKTDTNAAKKAPNEAIASPLLLRGDKIWTEAHQIPAILPDDSTTTYVQVYHPGGPNETTMDGTATKDSERSGMDASRLSSRKMPPSTTTAMDSGV